MFNVYKWVNKTKLRYYTISILKDNSNKILLNYSWGSCISNRGGKKNLFINEEEVPIYISQMIKRRKQRGYELVSPILN